MRSLRKKRATHTLENGIDYWVGLQLRSNCRFKVNVYSNSLVEIIKILLDEQRYPDGLFTLKYGDVEFEASSDDIMNCFELPYVATVYSSQASDIPEK